jgi:uncharacterized BrkB/YihY/UPF0761 family membrane protein
VRRRSQGNEQAAPASEDATAGAPLPEFITRDQVPQTVASRVREAVAKAKAASAEAQSRLERSRRERPLIDMGMETIDRDNSAGGGLLAGALAFRLFLAALPLVLVLVSLLGFLFDLDPDADETVESIGIGTAAARSVASSAEMAREGRWVTFAVGFFALVLALRTLVKSMRLVHVLAWRLPLARMRGMAKAVVVALAVIVAMLVVAGGTTWLRNRTPGGGVTLSVLLVLVWSVLWTGIELLLPRAPDTPWFVVLPGGVLLGIGTQVLHALTVFYFAGRVSEMSDTYGPLGAAVVALLWFYFFGRVFVYAAMLNATIWERYQRNDAMLPGGWGEWVTEKVEQVLRISPAQLGRTQTRPARVAVPEDERDGVGDGVDGRERQSDG